MFELMIQELEQVEIPSSQRSAFAGTEQSFRSFFELCHWGATVTWSSPDEFGFLALGSLVFLGVGAGIFGLWCRVGSSARNGGEVVTYQEIAMDDVG
jgi:iron-regulated transporter 1